MRTAISSGLAGVHTSFGFSDTKQWKVPVILALGAAAVIGLLLLGLQKRTEAKLLKMQYMVQTGQVEADGRVQTAQRELKVMTRKFQQVDAKMTQMQSELTLLQQMAFKKEREPARPGKPNTGHRKQKRQRKNGGLEDLGKLSGDVHLTSADDDPTTGFKKGELL